MKKDQTRSLNLFERVKDLLEYSKPLAVIFTVAVVALLVAMHAFFDLHSWKLALGSGLVGFFCTMWSIGVFSEYEYILYTNKRELRRTLEEIKSRRRQQERDEHERRQRQAGHC